MNKLIRVIKTWDCINFILQTEGEKDFWLWQVDKETVNFYHGTLTEFVNDIENTDIGCSESGFQTVEEAIQSIKWLNTSHRNLYTFFDEEQIETTEDCEHLIINGRKYKIYVTLSDRVSDLECCRVRVDGKYYYFG